MVSESDLLARGYFPREVQLTKKRRREFEEASDKISQAKPQVLEERR
jgi:hypothetical protein